MGVRKDASMHVGTECSFRLRYRPHFCWNSLLRYFRRRFYRGAEFVNGAEYFRTVRIGRLSGWVLVRDVAEDHALEVEVSPDLLPVLLPLIPRLRRLFDLDPSPAPIPAAP